MNKSDSISNLAVALVKTQAKLKGAIKDSKNPFFKSSYADLSSIWDACRADLTANGLSVVQTNEVAEHGVILETMLLHVSGEWISGRLLLNPTKNDPQGIGSAITYGRRYALAAMVGVCPEDDDGNAASEPVQAPAKREPAPKKALAPVVQPPAGDWSKVKIHFGKNINKTLGELEAQTVHWYWAEWMPSKQIDAKFAPKAEDKFLMGALNEWRLSRHPEEAQPDAMADKDIEWQADAKSSGASEVDLY